ncbi:MAG: hypothetical protein LBP69_09585 [Treponema sp.]|jgi:hypothetical protein|nr:hypothetical protein [Treponema sp.]
MSVLDDYREEDYNVRIEPGEHRLKIVKAEEKVFNSGNEGVKIELINKDNVRFFYHIIKNGFFNQNLTRFYDCFKIRRGETNLGQWAGRFGWAFVDKGKPNDNGKQFMEIKYLIVKKPGTGPSASESPMNEKRRRLAADIDAVINRANPDQLPYFTEQEKKRVRDAVSRFGPYENGIQALEKEKARVAALLEEREAGDKPIPGWEDPPEGGGAFRDDIPF